MILCFIRSDGKGRSNRKIVFFFMWKGKMLSEGIIGILGMNIRFPAWGPQAIVASMM